MLHEIGVELQEKLRARGCPFPVVDGPAGLETSWGDEAIVIYHDEGGDSFGPVLGAHKNPKHVATRTIGAKIQIFAQSPRSGAIEFEHRRRAEHVLDLVIAAMNDVAYERKNAWRPLTGRFVDIEDLKGSETLAGAVYELSFTFDRGVHDQTWKGAIQPEAAVSSDMIKSTTKVSLAHGPDDDNDPTTVPITAETACGT